MDRSLIEMLECPLTGSRLECSTSVGDDEIGYGILRSEAAEYPVVEGIPVMLTGYDDVVELVRAGRHGEALERMTLQQVPRGGVGRVLEALASIGRARPLAARMLARDDEGRRTEARRALDDGSPGSLVHFQYVQSTGRTVDAYDYFSLRAATPRYLVALSCIEAVPEGQGPVLDVGCGAGLVSWALQARVRPRLVVGVDICFVMLLTASRDVLRGGNFVCGDATALPFAARTFDAAIATDVLTFIDQRRTAVTELDRVLGPRGWCALTSLHTARSAHTFTNRPLNVGSWHQLVERMPHRVLSDDVIVERYRRGLGLPAGPGHEADRGDVSTRVTVVIARDESDLIDHGPFLDWPHARGVLQINPLYEVTGRTSEGMVYERRLPSDVFRVDNPSVDEYLPERVVVADTTLRALADGRRSPDVDDLIASLIVIGGPGPAWARR
jgi:SAM-dependent methyltransferase/uncharacterized protein YbaR (Trm112 family)